MAEIIKSDETFVRRRSQSAEALDIFADQQFKVELINELPEDAVITTYSIGRSPTWPRSPSAQHGQGGAFNHEGGGRLLGAGDSERRC